MNNAQRTIGPIEAAEIESRKVLKSRLWGSPERVEPIAAHVTSNDNKAAPCASVGKEGPLTLDPDRHVRDWRDWMANPPLAWLKRRCEEMGADYDEIVGPSQMRYLIAPRHAMMVEMRELFPGLSLPRIGRLFNRDHTVVIHAMQKAQKGKQTRFCPQLDRDDIRRMRMAGKTKKAIAHKYGVGEKTIRLFLEANGLS